MIKLMITFTIGVFAGMMVAALLTISKDEN